MALRPASPTSLEAILDLRFRGVPEPRTSVPGGSVALAGKFSAIYPRSSPGGWQLIGRTDTVLFDSDREPPALLQSGGTVRFVAVAGKRDGC